VLSSFCIVADDLSGAADGVASFAAVAGPVPVFLRGLEHGACTALDTDTRAMNEADACAVVRRVFAQLAACDLVYKKIDSTLRGHVGAELAAALQAAAWSRGVIVAPAFPRQGRALVGGKLLVHGRAPQDFGHGGDLMAMLDAARLQPALLSPPYEGAAALSARIDAAFERGARAIAADASSDEELAALAAAIGACGSRLLVAGSAGLAHALAAHVARGASGLAAPAPLRPGPVLVVVGSFSSASAAQVADVERRGSAQVLRLTPPQWLHEQHAAHRRDAADRARAALAAGRNVLLAIDGQPVPPFSRELVRAMAPLAAPLLAHASRCVLTGGDTARALFEAAGIARLDVGAELEPGISIGRAAAHPHCEFILKAGGFGDRGALQRAIGHGGRATT
jgi:D-threonate/D-erythronate kinase